MKIRKILEKMYILNKVISSNESKTSTSKLELNIIHITYIISNINIYIYTIHWLHNSITFDIYFDTYLDTFNKHVYLHIAIIM